VRGFTGDDRRTIVVVARRDIRERVLSKEFLVSTAASFAVIGLIVAIASATGDDGGETYEVGVVGDDAAAIGDAAAELAGQGGDDAVTVEVSTFASADEAEAAVRDGDVDAALVADRDVVVDEAIDDQLAVLLQTAHQLSESEQTEVLAAPTLAVRALDPVDQAEKDRESLTIIGTMLLYGQLFGYGYWVASAIVEEKSSRVIELLLAKSRPSALLTGKILGVGAVGLATLVANIVFGLGLAGATGAIDVPPGMTAVAAELTAWFVLGFALYSCLFAISGALASRIDELQNSSGPLTMVMIASLVVALNAANEPGGTVARIASFVPTTAPLVLPIRHVSDEVALWELGLGFAVVVATMAIVIPLTARIYAGSALFTRGPLGFRQALTRSGGA
jgi:ABC-2 type transport system permease protein